MSIKIGINGSASFNALKDLIVGTSDKTKQDVNRVEDWNGTIIWQRKAPDVPMDQDNTVITIYPTSYNESGSSASWGPYTPSVTKVTVNGVEIGTDKYQIEGYSNNSGTGTVSGQKGKVTISGKNGYTGTVYKEFSISYTYEEAKIDITNNCDITLAADSKTITKDKSATYTADETDLTLGVSKVALANYPWTQLIYNTDYTLKYEYPENKTYIHDKEGSLPKTVTVTVIGKGSYTGSKSKTYTVYHEYAEPVVHFIAAYASDADSDTPPYIYRFSASDGSALGKTAVGGASMRSNITCTCFGGNYNYAFLANGQIYRSKNGNSWSLAATLDKKYVTSCCFTGSRFVATTTGSHTESRSIIYSSDGTTWNTSTVTPLLSYSNLRYTKNIIYANGAVYAYAYDNNSAHSEQDNIVVSTDNGSTFTGYQPSGGMPTGYLCYGNNTFVAFAANDHTYVSSSPTTSWTATTDNVGLGKGLPCFGNGVFCIVGSNSSSANRYAYASATGDNWVQGTAGSLAFMDVCFANSNFYIVKNNSGKFSVLKSSNGTTFSSYGQDDISTSGEAEINMISY